MNDRTEALEARDAALYLIGLFTLLALVSYLVVGL